MERDTEHSNKTLDTSIDLGTTDDVQEYMLGANGEMDADGDIDTTLNALDASTGIDDGNGSDPDISTLNAVFGPVETIGKTSKPKARKSSAAKPKAKPKPKASKGITKAAPKARLAQLKASGGSNSRGRSASETPAPSVGEIGTPAPVDASVAEDEAEEEEDTKLYCMCQALYDEEKMMIACDKCDEWYHPICVNLSETQVELVDAFFCPKCVASDTSLVTSYKPVCARVGCTRPGRPPLSKYCSEDCGIRVVMARVDAWNGDIDRLMDHPSVATAKPIEGLLVMPQISSSTAPSDIGACSPHEAKGLGYTPLLLRDNEEIHRQLRLKNEEIQRISADRDLRERLRQALDARLQLLGRASLRRRSFGDGALCCFDSRLIFDEDAWAEWLNDGGWELIQQDGAEEQGPWYCANKRKCDRHHGWEELKAADFELEEKVLGQRMAEMSARERDLRLQIENLQTLLQARQTTAASRAKHSSRT